MSFAGKRVLSLESRRATETAELIRRNGGDPFVARSMREAPLERNEAVFEFTERLFHGDFDMIIFLTGVGTRYLVKAISTRYDPDLFTEALRRTTVVARGPKPMAALRELGVPVQVNAPEPNTWRELLQALEGRPERRIAIQEYGRSNEELVAGLRERGAEVTCIPVYAYEMPEDLEPLRQAIARLCAGEFEVVLFTTSQQVVHLMQVAEEQSLQSRVREAMDHTVVGSIGPTTTEMLTEFGVKPDLEPSHPKLGILVKETAEQAEAILCRKRT